MERKADGEMIYSLVQLVKSINKEEGTRAADLLLWSPASVVLCRKEKERKERAANDKKAVDCHLQEGEDV